jgi:hypothetical protein
MGVTAMISDRCKENQVITGRFTYKEKTHISFKDNSPLDLAFYKLLKYS